jgi:hypothetical protein
VACTAKQLQYRRFKNYLDNCNSEYKGEAAVDLYMVISDKVVNSDDSASDILSVVNNEVAEENQLVKFATLNVRNWSKLLPH